MEEGPEKRGSGPARVKQGYGAARGGVVEAVEWVAAVAFAFVVGWEDASVLPWLTLRNNAPLRSGKGTRGGQVNPRLS